MRNFFHELGDEPHQPYRWQTELKPGDYCVFPVMAHDEVKFIYLLLVPPPDNIPPDFLFGQCFSEEIQEPEYAAVHPSAVFKQLSFVQFETAQKNGFRSDIEAVASVMNYTSIMGNA